MKITFASVLFLLTLILSQSVEAQGRRPGPGPRPMPGPGGYRPMPPSGPGPGGYRPNPTPPPSRPDYRPSPGPGPIPGGYRPAPPMPPRPEHRPSPGPGPIPGGYRPAPPMPPRPDYRPSPGPGPIPGGYRPAPPMPPRPDYRPSPGPRPIPGGYRPAPPPSRPTRTQYGTPDYHRPYGYSRVRYNPYYHAPYRAPYSHTVRYYRTYDWYSYVLRSFPNYVYVHWIFYPASGHSNGYWTIDGYPYYVFNGYRHRYSSYDYCNYQLVDEWNHSVVQTYWNQMCNTGYDSCSYERDRLNSQMGEYRYFCAETYRDYGYDYSRPTYDDYESCTDYDNDGYCDPRNY